MPKQRTRAAAKEVPADAEIDEDDISTVGTPEQLYSEGDAVDLSELGDDDYEAPDDGVPRVTEPIRVKKPVRNVRIDDSNRMTPNIMSPMTAAALIAIRTEQIGRSGTAMIDASPYETNEQVAIAELFAQKCPIIVARQCGKREFDDRIEIYTEYVRASEMILPKTLRYPVHN